MCPPLRTGTSLPSHRADTAVQPDRDEHGRGLLLVDGIAARWGTTAYGTRAPHSKTVWFTLSASGR
ncbi:hypothetical protein [Streptomyces sp. NPDC002403]